MKTIWPSLAGVVLLFTGCTRPNEPPKPSPQAPLPKGERMLMPSPPAALPKGEERAGRFDDFGLPLDIYLEVPDVPKELMGPSPPIEEKPAAKKK